MALQMEYQAARSPIGVYLPAAYVRIASITLVDARVSFSVLTYADDVAYESGAPFIRSETYTYDGFDQNAGANVKSQLYDWLKAQPQFQGAADY